MKLGHPALMLIQVSLLYTNLGLCLRASLALELRLHIPKGRRSLLFRWLRSETDGWDVGTRVLSVCFPPAPDEASALTIQKSSLSWFHPRARRLLTPALCAMAMVGACLVSFLYSLSLYSSSSNCLALFFGAPKDAHLRRISLFFCIRRKRENE